MGGFGGAIIAAIGGGLLAVGLGFGFVSSQSAAPAPVDSPYIVYGDS